MDGRGGSTTGRYVVTDALGDAYAIRHDYEEIRREASAAIDYLDGAYRCGHPLAAGWVSARGDIRIMWWPLDEVDAWLLNEGTPILDREPVYA